MSVRAMRLYGPKQVRLEEVPRPDLRAGEVLVQVESGHLRQ